jgi:hypothetical protein
MPKLQYVSSESESEQDFMKEEEPIKKNKI